MAGGLCGCAVKAAPVAKSTFTSEQRAQIVHIMRDAMKQDPTILRDAIIVLQADNDRLEAQARRTAVARYASGLADSGDPSVGNPRGNVTVVEFFDPRCPYCRQLAPVLARFVARNGDVRLVYKDYPILGPASELGSRALLAAQLQGRYEALREVLMASPPDFTRESIRAAAALAHLDWPRLQRDMDSAAVAQKVAANRDLASALGIDGTPTLVIGEKIVEGADLPTIAAAVANARHDRSHDQSKATVGMSLRQ
jgi:protein-disulfide isomerase